MGVYEEQIVPIKIFCTEAQQQMVKDSMTRAFDELHSGQAKHDARKLFKK